MLSAGHVSIRYMQTRGGWPWPNGVGGSGYGQFVGE